MPHDSGHRGGAANRDLSGDELYAWLRHLAARTARVTLLFDCCHSGTITRDVLARERWLERDERPPVPQPFPWIAEDPRLPTPGASGWLPVDQAYTLIAACRSDERAHETVWRDDGERVHGALTGLLLQALASPGPEATYRDVVEPVARAVTKRFPDQHPQLEGAGDRLLFQLEPRPPRRHLVVKSRRECRLMLGGGAVHRVRPGSRWAIHAASAKTMEGDPLGHAWIEAVRAVESDAVLEGDPPPAAVAPGCRAVEVDPGIDPFPLAVAVRSRLDERHFAASLRRGIDASPHLRLTAPDDAELVAWLLPPRPKAAFDEPAVAIGPIEQPICAVVDRGSQVVVPYKTLESPEIALADTLHNLEGRARYERLRGLANPEPNVLMGKVEWRLMRRSEDGWIDAAPVGLGRPARFRHGEAFALEIRSRHDEQTSSTSSTWASAAPSIPSTRFPASGSPSFRDPASSPATVQARTMSSRCPTVCRSTGPATSQPRAKRS